MHATAGWSAATAVITVASMIAGDAVTRVAGTPVGHGTHADHAGIALLSDTAIFVGPTTLSTPSATFAQTAANLFLQPLGFDAGEDPTACVIGTGDCDAPLQILSTPELIQQGHSAFVGAYEIVEAVQAELAAHPDGTFDADHPLWVFGYSQGATAGSIAMTQLAHDSVDPDALHFVFIGDPSAADGQLPNIQPDPESSQLLDFSLVYGIQTPDDAFPTTTYAVPGDPVADYSADPLGLFYEHLMYLGLTPEQVADHTESTDGMLTSIDISGDFDQFGAWLNAFGNGLIDSSWWEGLFNSAVAFFYQLFDNIEDFFGDWIGVDWSDVEDGLDAWFPTD